MIDAWIVPKRRRSDQVGDHGQKRWPLIERQKGSECRIGDDRMRTNHNVRWMFLHNTSQVLLVVAIDQLPRQFRPVLAVKTVIHQRPQQF